MHREPRWQAWVHPIRFLLVDVPRGLGERFQLHCGHGGTGPAYAAASSDVSLAAGRSPAAFPHAIFTVLLFLWSMHVILESRAHDLAFIDF